MAKKTFKNNINPAMQFISEDIPKENNKPLQSSINKKDIPEGYKANPAYIETKSKRVQLLAQPSTVEAIKSLAKANNISMNEAINEAIKEYIDKHTRG